MIFNRFQKNITNLFSSFFSKRFISSYFIIILVSAILVSIWFKDGNIMGTGESGLPFYDFQIQSELVKTAWFKYALGGPSNVNLASGPTYFALGQLQRLGVSTVLMQALFFWICLVVSGIAVYKLVQEFFPELKQRHLVLAVFFYWFNPVSLVNVWNRFLNNYFIFFAFLPLSLYLFIKGLKTRKYYYSFWFVIYSAFFSYVHSSMAFNILLWFVIFYTALFYILNSKNFKERIYILKFTFVYFSLWLLTNIWWISQVFNYVYSQSFAEVTDIFFTNLGNYFSFSDISARLGGLADIFSLTNQAFYFNTSLTWFQVYNFFVFKGLSYLIVFLTLLGIFWGRKKIAVLFFGLLSIITLYLIKGNNYPLGELFGFLFLKSSALQLFRNPFEKFGFLLVLALTPLFAFSMWRLEEINKKLSFLFVLVAFYIIVGWGFPYWTGLVFTAPFPPVNDPKIKYEVIVPDDYKLASSWLKSQGGDFRLVVFPLLSEGITYEWQKGFSGIELSNQLFPVTSVSFDTTIPFYHDVAEKLERAFVEDGQFYPLMNVLNAKYILLREDINWKERKMRDPQVLLNVLRQRQVKGEFKRVATFGKLSFWENLHYTPSEVTVASNPLVISKQSQVNDLAGKNSQEVLMSLAVRERINSRITAKPGLPVFRIYPDNKLVIRKFDDNKLVPQNIFPYISTYPDNRFYPLIQIKEQIQNLLITDPRAKLDYSITILGKRLREAVFEGQRGNTNLMLKSLERYKTLLITYKNLYREYQITLPDFYKENFQIDNAEIFYKHLRLFNDLKGLNRDNSNVLTKIDDDINFLKVTIADLNIYPIYNLTNTDKFPLTTRLIYKFSVPENGKFRLLIKDRKLLANFDVPAQSMIQLNDQIITVSPQWTSEGNLMLTELFLKKGDYEISLNSLMSKNLIKAPPEVDMTVDHGNTVQDFTVANFVEGRNYRISFDYFIKEGYAPSVLLYTDNASIKQNQKTPLITFQVNSDFYNFDKKKFEIVTGNVDGAAEAQLILKLAAWNNCTIVNWEQMSKCLNQNFHSVYDKRSETIISNLSVTEEFNEKLYLEGEVLNSSQRDYPTVSYRKLDPTKYEVNISGVRNNYFLILSQLLDVGWKLKTVDDKEIGLGPLRVNIFENGWLLNQPGDYKLILEYEPQRVLEIAEKISSSVLAGVVVLLATIKLKTFFKK